MERVLQGTWWESELTSSSNLRHFGRDLACHYPSSPAGFAPQTEARDSRPGNQKPGSAERGDEFAMNNFFHRAIETWEDEGGAPRCVGDSASVALTGSAAQVEWAERIRILVNADFGRVAAAFRVVAGKQIADKRADTEMILDILEDKRVEVMSRRQAGYFIHDWQEIGDQVRQLVFHDERYKAIKRNRPARPL